MTWQPGQPVATTADEAEWRAWRKASKLHAQRQRRLQYRRIDYYPSKGAQAVIDACIAQGYSYSSTVDALVLAVGVELPE
ncbi:MAG TPA: hypothetical protein VJN66_04510 [Rhodanobacteraceae bacterium]|nr:hypothetical protein [Rhodanobacteraceae bacterium]